jgi:Transposase DDE domain
MRGEDQQRGAMHSYISREQWARKRVEEIFGWMRTIVLLRKLRHRGQARVEWMFTFTVAAYNLTRARKLLAQAKA